MGGRIPTSKIDSHRCHPTPFIPEKPTPPKAYGVFRRPFSIQKVVMFLLLLLSLLLLLLLLFSERKVVSPTRTLPWKSEVSLLKLQHYFTSLDRVGLNCGNLIRLGMSWIPHQKPTWTTAGKNPKAHYFQAFPRYPSSRKKRISSDLKC